MGWLILPLQKFSDGMSSLANYEGDKSSLVNLNYSLFLASSKSSFQSFDSTVWDVLADKTCACDTDPLAPWTFDMAQFQSQTCLTSSRKIDFCFYFSKRAWNLDRKMKNDNCIKQKEYIVRTISGWFFLRQCMGWDLAIDVGCNVWMVPLEVLSLLGVPGNPGLEADLWKW